MKTNWLSRIAEFLRPKQKVHHVWKTEREENLDSFMHLGEDIHDIDTFYRIAVFERCLVTGETRIRERISLFPVTDVRNKT